MTYYLSLDTEASWQIVSRTYQYRGGFFERHTTQTALRTVERGTLLLDILEPERRRAVCRGTARARVRRDWDTERREEKINDALAKTPAQFPPGGPQFRPAARASHSGATGQSVATVPGAPSRW